MITFEDIVEVRNWKREKVLGSGGFGTVTLWKEKNGDRMIALKYCRGGADTLLTAKQKERWKKEVEIMQRLNHPNVVRALALPEDLANFPSELPMLCMEYCVKGDLRQMLNRPENCCGLSEGDVRRLVQNVCSAVHYLHSEKITHRDLKPENIVLSQGDSGIIYKLIDLGYAKELDQSSICTSFVGTLQYLAPELFTNEKYSSSVDYWSLGLVSHEVITGVRPFLPSMAPVAWMKHVRKKSPDHICAYQTQDGRIEFSSHLLPQNHISSVFKQDMERWLKIALEWDPKKRGRNAEGEVIVFSEMEKIMSKKVIQVFCMVTYERLSYKVEDSTQLSEIRGWIEVDTKVAAKEQELLLASGQQLDANGTVNQCYNGLTYEALYVCKQGILELSSESPRLPELVANLLQFPKDKLEYIHQRRAYSHAVFFLQQENKLYRDFLVGCRLKLLSLVLKCQKVIRETQRVMDLTNSLSSLREFCIDAYKFDVMQARKLKINGVTLMWQQKMDAIDLKWAELHEKAKLLIADSQKATKTARKLQTTDSSSAREDATLNSLLEDSLGIMDKLRRRPNSERSTPRDSLDMVKILYKSLKQRDCLLHNTTLSGHLKQLSDCELELHRLLPKMEEMYHKLNDLKHEIVVINRERQRNVWDLLASSIPEGKMPIGSMPFDISNLLPPSESSALVHSLSSHSIFTEENPPPVPPHGAPILSRVSSVGVPPLPLCFNNSSHSIYPSQPYFLLSTNDVAFDTSDSQHHLPRSHLANGIDSNTASGFIKHNAKGSTASLAKDLIDNSVASSIINENRSLRARAQELIMESLSELNKVIDQDLDWSFLETK